MDLFYIIVLGIALVLLIIILAFIGIGMTKNPGTGSMWPPVASTCPDYWKVDPTNKDYCIIPGKGTRNSGTIYRGDNIDSNFETTNGYDKVNKRINFSDPYFIACNKQKWAKKWGVFWDGYSNYNGCNVSK